MSEWRRFAGTGDLDRALADHIAQRLAADIEQHGRASLAVSGGGTPERMFQHLSCCELNWSRVWVTLVDERWVAPDSKDSNERLVRARLLQDRASAANFVSLKAAQDDANDALAEVGERLAQMPQPFSVIVLGMGGDGHTASWFPQADNLQDLLDPLGSRQLAATDPVTAPHQRITLTMPAVLNSRELIIHITGVEKERVLASARENNFPIAAVLDQHTTPATIWWAP